MAGHAVVAQVIAEHVGRGGPERVVLVEAAFAVGLREERLELLLRVAPREIAVVLREAGIGERAHERRAAERLGEEQHLGVLLRDRGEHVLPETHRLGLRLVDLERGHAGFDPHVDNPFDLALNAGQVVVEVELVERLGVAVLVERVHERSVGVATEPFGVRGDPGVGGCAAQRQAEGHFEAELMRACAEGLEIFHRAELRVHGVVAAGRRAHREQVCVRRTVVDGEDGGQVRDGEPFAFGALKAADGGAQRAGRHLAAFVDGRAFGAREELVPCAEARLGAFHVEHAIAARRESVAQRVGGVQGLNLVDLRDGEAFGGGDRRVEHLLGGLAQHLALRGVQTGVARGGPARENFGAAHDRAFGVGAAGVGVHAGGGVEHPIGVGVGPALNGHFPVAELAEHVGEALVPRRQVGGGTSLQHGGPGIEPGVRLGHRHAGHHAAARVLQHGGGAHGGAAFEEDLRAHGERFAELHAGGEHGVLSVWTHIEDGDAAEQVRLFGGYGRGRHGARSLRGSLGAGPGGGTRFACGAGCCGGLVLGALFGARSFSHGCHCRGTNE